MILCKARQIWYAASNVFLLLLLVIVVAVSGHFPQGADKTVLERTESRMKPEYNVSQE
jgi:hypothetical protein